MSPHPDNTTELGQLLVRLVELLAPPARHDPDEWIPVAELATPYRQTLDAIRAGALIGSKVGRCYMVRRRDYDEWLSSCRVQPTQTAQPKPETPKSLGAQVLELGRGR